MGEQIFRVSVPALIDVKAVEMEDAISAAIAKVVEAGFGLGNGQVQVNYETVDYIEEQP